MNKKDYTDYNNVPWYRKSSWNTVFVFLTFIKLFISFFMMSIAPILAVVGLKSQSIILNYFLDIFTSPILITVYSLMTGNIYINKLDNNGFLKKWSVLNKVVAWIILALIIISF